MVRDLYSRIEGIVTESGLWAGEQRQTHAFRPTSSIVGFTSAQVEELKRLGPTIAEVLQGMSRILTVAHNLDVAEGEAWRVLRKVMSMEVPGFMAPLQSLYPKQAPLLIKVDVMEDGDGQFHLAEIDATNRRGMGYTSLFERLRSEVKPRSSAPFTPIVEALAGLVKRLCGKGRPQLGYVYAHRERFYLSEFLILRDALRHYDVELLVGDELETNVVGDTVVINGTPCESALLADFAIKLERKELIVDLSRLYKEKRVRLLIPPRPFLGSKALLALLHNAEGDAKIEAILRSMIDGEAIDHLRQRVPMTRFVTKSSVAPTSGVLKEVISSGMKGVYFVGDPAFKKGFADARSRPYQYVVQDEIVCRRRRFQVLSSEGGSRENLRTRLILYYVLRSPAGGLITATEEKAVHGGGRAVFTGITAK